MGPALNGTYLAEKLWDDVCRRDSSRMFSSDDWRLLRWLDEGDGGGTAAETEDVELALMTGVRRVSGEMADEWWGSGWG